MIHHTPHPERVVAAVAQRLKPDGEFRLMLYSRYCWKVLGIYLRYGFREPRNVSHLVAKYSEAQTGCPITYIYSLKEIRHLLSQFDIVNITKEHIFPYRIPEYVQGRYVKRWYFQWIPNVWFRWLEKILGWHLLIVARRRHESPRNGDQERTIES